MSEVICLVEIGVYRRVVGRIPAARWLRILQPQLASKPPRTPLKPLLCHFPVPPDFQGTPGAFRAKLDPALATLETPPEAQFYSARNSVAANPEPKKDTPTPGSGR